MLHAILTALTERFIPYRDASGMPGLFFRLIDSILLPTNKNGPFTGPFFYVQDYVQDERYIAREHMDVRRDCVSFARCLAQGCAGAVRVSFARCLVHGCVARLCQIRTACLNLPGRQGGVVSYFRTCREPIHGGAFSTSCLVRS